MGKKRGQRRKAAPKAKQAREAGEVVEMLGLEAIVRPSGQTEVSVRARLRKGIARNPGVVVGDVVEFARLVVPEGDEGGPEAVLEAVRPRKNLLLRAGYQGRRQRIAANLDYVVIVVSPAEPPLRLGLIDRYLVAARQASIDPVICLNKCDLDEGGAAYEALGVYEQLGVPVVRTLVTPDDVEIDALREALAGRRSILVGHSGVGKSSMAKALIPDLVRAVGPLNETTGRGRHTTTTATLLDLPAPGGQLVDTPGIRGFGIFGVLPERLQDHYPEYLARAEDCRFRECNHTHEPGCAVKAAVDDGELDEDRYERYLDIRVSLEEW